MAHATYELRAGSLGPDDLWVHRFVAREELTAPYTFDIEVLCPRLHRNVEELVLGAPARFGMRLGPAPRVVHGIVSRVESLGVVQHELRDHVHYRVELVPKLWLLSQRTCSRVFQRLRVDEIVRAVLDEAHVPSAWLLTHDYPTRELCIQYEETDLAFVTRLLAENGIFYFFEALPEGEVPFPIPGLDGGAAAIANALGERLSFDSLLPTGEVVVFADDAQFYPPLRRRPDELGDLLRGALARGAERLGSAAGAAIGGAGGEAAADGITRGASALGAAFGAGADAGVALAFRPDADALRGREAGCVRSFTLRGAVRPDQASFRDVDPRRPLAPFACAARARGEGAGGRSVEAAQGLAAAARRSAADVVEAGVGVGRAVGAAVVDHALPERNGGLEVYEHRVHHLFPDWKHEGREAERMLRRARRDAREGLGGSDCALLAPGHRFHLEGHPLEWFNADYVVVRVEHRGRGYELPAGATADPVYENSFHCVPSQVPWLPARPERRRMETCLTATVVGGGDEINTTDFTMIKVKFHWDRRSSHADTSCWVRTAQSWAGAGWGTQFIPRDGMEVVVGFDSGDIDKPIVLGCVYNGVHPPPFRLPEEKTRSGIRTCSTPGSSGKNELSFEDAVGHEQIYVHAERDWDSDVKRDRTLLVRRNDSNEIAGTQSVRVHREQTVRVEGGRRTVVEPHDELEVRGDATRTVRGNAGEHVLENARTEVGGSVTHAVTGNLGVEVGGDVSERCGGNHTLLVGGAGAPRGRFVRVEGQSEVSTSAANRLSSDEEIVLACGASFIRITPERVEIASPEVRIQGDGARVRLGDDEARIFASQKLQAVAQSLVLKGSGAALGLTSEAAVEGVRILLNSPQAALDPAPEDEKPPTVIELADDQGRPLAHQRYRIALGDGSSITGILDANGRAEIDLASGGDITFPGLDEVQSS